MSEFCQKRRCYRRLQASMNVSSSELVQNLKSLFVKCLGNLIEFRALEMNECDKDFGKDLALSSVFPVLDSKNG